MTESLPPNQIERREQRMPLLAVPEEMRNSVTGLPNEDALRLVTEDAIQRLPGNFAEIDMDLDGLQEHNTLYGHPDADEYLRTTGAVLGHSLRANDIVGIVAHPHGDEFRIIVGNVNTQDQVDSIIDRLRDDLEEYGIEGSMGGRPHQVGESATQLAIAADNLMYQDKIDRKLSNYSAGQLREAHNLISRATASGIRIRDLGLLAKVFEENPPR